MGFRGRRPDGHRLRRIPGAAALPPNDAAEGPNPIGYLPLGGEYQISGNRPGNEAGRLTAVGAGFVASATTSAGSLKSAAAVQDRFQVAGSKHEATLTPGTAGAQSLTEFARGAGGQTFTASLAGRGSPGAADSLKVAKDGVITLGHTGAAATRTLTLSYTGRSALSATAQVSGLALGAGDRVVVHVHDWSQLKGVTAVRRHNGRTSRSTLHMKRVTASLIGRVKVSARSAARRLTLTARVTHRGSSAWTAAGVTFLVARGKHVVAKQTVPLTDRGGVVTWKVPKRLAKGSYRIVALATASVLSSDGIARSDSKSARATAKVG